MAISPDALRRARSRALALCAAAASTVFVLPATSSVAEPHRSLDQVKSRVATLEHKAEVAAEKFNTARERRQGVQQRIQALRSRVHDKQGHVSALEKQAGDFAAATYRNGGASSEMRLLFADSPRQMLDSAGALQQFARRQATVLHDVQQAKNALAADQHSLVAREKRLSAIDHTLHARKVEVETKLRKANDLLDSLEAKQRARLEAQRRAAAARAAREARASRNSTGDAQTTSTSSGSPSSGGSVSVSASGAAATAVAFARAQLGEPYVWGAAGPDSWDCSGLTMMAWKAAGVSLPHSSSMQYSSGRKVSRSNLQPGDLVFYYSPISHVAIYIGNGQIIHAPNPSTPVSVAPVDLMPYSGAVRP